MTDSIYESIITSKTGSEIPVLKNGMTLESRYNPEREADQIAASFEKNQSFFVLIGLGSGILAKKILENNSEAKILAVEPSQKDFDFLKSIKTVDELSKNKNVIFCDFLTLEEKLIQNYIPAVYGSIKIHENRNWLNYNSANAEKIRNHIQNALTEISRDFSVQAHFGKIWQKNILSNLKILLKEGKNKYSIPAHKTTAAVIAAGPSLDRNIEKLRDSKYFIIATDTAFSSLQKNHIKADAVVSIDAQKVSSEHFFDVSKSQNKDTLFFLDLCGNFSASKKLLEADACINYFISGHPLSRAASSWLNNSLMELSAGAGTVTISALDLSVQLGFSEIEVFGADFAYSDGKPYTKGTYLDGIYARTASKINPAEKQFTRLMYRAPVIKNSFGPGFTSDVLLSYRKSFEEYLNSHGFSFHNKDQIYFIKNFNKLSQIKVENNNSEMGKKSDLSEFIKKLTESDGELPVFLLPYIAWLRKNSDFKEYSFKELCRMAEKSLKRYEN